MKTKSRKDYEKKRNMNRNIKTKSGKVAQPYPAIKINKKKKWKRIGK